MALPGVGLSEVGSKMNKLTLAYQRRLFLNHHLPGVGLSLVGSVI